MMNIPNASIKDKASYVVISTTSLLFVKWEAATSVQRLLHKDNISCYFLKDNIFTKKKNIGIKINWKHKILLDHYVTSPIKILLTDNGINRKGI